jgi:hypothetical protein
MRTIVAPLLCLAALAGCGGGGDEERPRAETRARPAPAPVPTPGLTGPQRTPLDLPPGVPTVASGAPAPGSERVIRAWTDAVRDADFDAAAELFGRRARVQNGTPVFILQDRAAAKRWNAALPCGARVTRARGASRGFTIVRFRLVERRGADCGSGTGGDASAIVRVRDGRITEWYRLPDGAGVPRADALPS